MDLIYRLDPFQPMKPRHVEGPDQAVAILEEGNRVYGRIVGQVREVFRGGAPSGPLVLPLDPMTFGVSMIEGSTPAQTPFALVLGCSDARAPVEVVFHQSSNDLFVVRVAGNVLGVECLGSIDYAVRNMESLKLVVVLGHTHCGAVTAAVDMYLGPTNYPNLGLTHALRSLIDRVMMAVRGAAEALDRVLGPGAAREPGYRAALIEVAVFLNAALTAFDLQRELKALGRGPGVGVVYGVFDIASQRVRRAPGGPESEARFAPAPSEAGDFDDLAAGLARAAVGRA